MVAAGRLAGTTRGLAPWEAVELSRPDGVFIGTAQGITFMATSVLSGLSIGLLVAMFARAATANRDGVHASGAEWVMGTP